MERESYGEQGDFVRNTEPVRLDRVPVRDGRDHVQNARPPQGAERPPKTAMERQLGYTPLTKRG